MIAEASAWRTTRPTVLMASIDGTRTATTRAPRPSSNLGRPVHGLGHASLDALEVVVLGKADAEARERDLRGRDEVFGREAAGALVARVESGDGVKRGGGIAHRARDRPHVVEGEIERHHAVTADAAVAGLEPDRAAVGSGDADGAAGVAAHGQEHHAGGDRRGRSAAGAAGNPLQVPRVAHRAEMRVGRGDAVGQLVQVGLADQHRAGFGQLFDHRGVMVRARGSRRFWSRKWCGSPGCRIRP